MYRRIELTNKLGDNFWRKTGLMGFYDEKTQDVLDAWINKLSGPCAPRNSRFYFTEEGWKEVGSKVVDACKKTGQEFRIITIKEKSVDVIAKGPFEVAVRPRKKKKEKGDPNAD